MSATVRLHRVFFPDFNYLHFVLYLAKNTQKLLHHPNSLTGYGTRLTVRQAYSFQFTKITYFIA